MKYKFKLLDWQIRGWYWFPWHNKWEYKKHGFTAIYFGWLCFQFRVNVWKNNA